MKKVTCLLFALFLFEIALAQIPGNFNYQAVIRNDAGELLTSQNVSVSVSIIDNSATGSVLYSETHSTTTNAYGAVNLVIGTGSSTSGDFSEINWGENDKYLGIEVDEGNGYVDMGTVQLLSVPYSNYANVAYNAEVLGSASVYTTTTDTLFVVKDHEGNVVFAVFPDGAEIIVNETTKGKIGGFAVSGRNPAKATDTKILNITADSTRIYVNDTVTNKGKIGGFAVSGRNPAKNMNAELLFVTADSTRVYVNEGSGTKGKIGGFAVSGRNPAKGTETDYFNISNTTTAEIIDPSEPRILWYPNKEAFLAGRVLVESPDSIGTNSMATGFESKSIGAYSQALGYKARAKGANSSAIGNNSNAEGIESYAFGNSAHTEGTGSYAIGSGAKASGTFSFALGSTGVNDDGFVTYATQAIGNYAYAFGMGSVAGDNGAFAFGTQDTASGKFCTAIGVRTKATQTYSTAMGVNTLASGTGSTAMGASTVASGNYSIAMGQQTIASKGVSTAMGLQTEASGWYSTAMSWGTTASGDNSVAMGYFTQANGNSAFAMGYESVADTNFTTAFGYQTSAIGLGSTAMGYKSIADTAYATATGYQTTAGGYGSFTAGWNTKTTGNYSVAMGWNSQANEWASTALGYNTTADGNSSISMGYGTTASGGVSTAIGNGIEAAGNYSVGIGLGASTSDVISDDNTMAIMGGEVGIGTVSPDKLFHVAGDARFEGDIYYGASGGTDTYDKPDFVFTDEYNKRFDIIYTEEFIEKNGHLPWLTSADNEKDGINITRMAFETLETVENQQLQIISLKKENETLKTEIEILKEKLNKIEMLLEGK